MEKSLSFICIGVQKAGTSTLHDILVQHPNLNLPIFKETHHFSEEESFNKGKEYYFKYYFNNYFKKTKKIKYYGEIDPEYSYFREAANRIKVYFPNTKILIILRNPVERAYSHYLMTKRRGLEPLQFDEAIRKEQQRLLSHDDKMHFSYISRGHYLELIEEYELLFGPENVKIVLFEDLVKKTKQIVDDITLFIGLPPYEYDYNIKSNVASEARSEFVRDFIHKDSKTKKTIGKLIPSKRIKHFIMHNISQANLKRVKKKPLTNNLEKEIYENYFKEEIEKLEKKLQVDLSSWKY